MKYEKLSTFCYIGFNSKFKIAGPGLEPGFSASKAGVLPLDDPALDNDVELYQNKCHYQNLLILYKIISL